VDDTNRTALTNNLRPFTSNLITEQRHHAMTESPERPELSPIRGSNTGAIVALSSGLLGLLILPILLGPLAFIAGCANCGIGKPAAKTAMVGLLLGLWDTMVVVIRLAPYFQQYYG
jgi:hypothetical protein